MITPAILDKNTEYADKYVVKLFDDFSRFHGHMHNPTIAQIYPPRRMLRYLGNSAVMSVPAETLLAAMLVPSWASTNAVAMMNTPKRSADVASSRRNCERSSRGFQIAVP
jgi:hypothetical protein